MVNGERGARSTVLPRYPRYVVSIETDIPDAAGA